MRAGFFGHVTQQTFTRFFTRPVSANAAVPWKQREEDYDRRVYGYGANLSGRYELAAKPMRWIAGVEGYSERTDFVFQDGLDNRRPTTATLTTEQRQDRRFDFDTFSAFAQGEWELSPYARPTLAVRYDRFTGDCTVRGIEIRAEPCGPMNDYDRTTPKVGVCSTVFPGLELRASYAEGFQLPTGAAKFTPGGAVEPTTFKQYEVGAQWQVGGSFFADIAVFRIDSKDEIFLANASQLLYANLGKTRRDGVEADLRWYPSSAWEFTAAHAYFDSEIRESPTSALVGKRIPSTPRTQATVQATWRFLPEWGARVTYCHIGEHVVDAGNSIAYGGYDIVDAGVFYERTYAGKRQRYSVTVTNIADNAYATTALTFAGQPAFSLGAPIGVIAQASLDF